MGMAGVRPAMMSAAMRAEPCDMVQPMWPWPQLRMRLLNRRRPMSGGLVEVIGLRPAHISARSYSAPSGKSSCVTRFINAKSDALWLAS